ncbi:MLO-like protein 10 [Acorus gramineus]|uniref:MLO-like protein 10 n=1 Tax=Acorus gramineus TaxID=55184 RepID=A0AAV9AF46_ACOGR|nr:MLO-like protein 10 [Acorus gramineus]
MAGGAGLESRNLDQTPTWAVSAVCAVIIIISIVLEKILHRVGEWFNERRKKALFDALEKVKSELMILGFISLLLSFVQNYIAEICIPEKTADTMLPCRLRKTTVEEDEGHWKRHLSEDIFDNLKSNRRSLAAGGPAKTCAHIRRWKEWEKETTSLDYEFSDRWQALFWVALVPLIIILAVGTKLQAIITKMALEINERHAVVQGIPLVQLSDRHFWFGSPQLVLFLLHFTLFQMGTHVKKSIFDEQTSRALKKWRKDAKKKQGKPSQGSRTPGGGTPEASPSTSPVHPLQRFKTTGHSGSKKSMRNFSDPEFDTPESTSVLIQTGSREAALAEEHHDGDDFSFSKPPIV